MKQISIFAGVLTPQSAIAAEHGDATRWSCRKWRWYPQHPVYMALPMACAVIDGEAALIHT